MSVIIPQNQNPMIGDLRHEPSTGDILVWGDGGWIPIANEVNLSKDDIIDAFENNPELYNEVMLEMRNKKIKKIKNK